MADDYAIDEADPTQLSTSSMFSGGAPHVGVSGTGLVVLALYFAVVVAMVAAWFAARAHASKEDAKKQRAKRDKLRASVKSIEKATPSLGKWLPSSPSPGAPSPAWAGGGASKAEMAEHTMVMDIAAGSTTAPAASQVARYGVTARVESPRE